MRDFFRNISPRSFHPASQSSWPTPDAKGEENAAAAEKNKTKDENREYHSLSSCFCAQCSTI